MKQLRTLNPSSAATFLMGLAMLASCTGNKDQDTDSPDQTTDGGVLAESDPDEGQTFEAAFTALDGGMLETDSGGILFTMERGGLWEDTSITVDVLAPADGTLAPVYDFGPEGIELASPATLKIRVTAAEVDDPVIAWANADGDWIPLANSTYDGEFVTADIAHFTDFTLVPRTFLANSSAFIRLTNGATLTGQQTLTLEVDYKGNKYLIEDQEWNAGGFPLEIPNVDGTTSASYKILGNGIPVNPLAEGNEPLKAGVQYHVFGVTDNLEKENNERGIYDVWSEFEIADIEAKYTVQRPRVLIRFLVEGESQAQAHGLEVWKRPSGSNGPFQGPYPIPENHEVWLSSLDNGEFAFAVDNNLDDVHALPLGCIDFDLKSLEVTEPMIALIIGTDPTNADASDPNLTIDLMNGMETIRSDQECPCLPSYWPGPC